MKTIHFSIITAVLIGIVTTLTLTLLVTPTAFAQPGRIFFGSQQPQLSVSDDKINIVWDYYNPDDSLYLATSNDGGSSFGEKIRLNKNDTWDMGIGNTAIDNNNVYHV